MRILKLLPLILLIMLISSCDKENSELFENGRLTFSRLVFEENGSSVKIGETIVSYDQILAYDSAQLVFQLEEYAWKRIENEITPSYPDPNFGFGVVVDSELMYRVGYIPGYHSYSYPERIKFIALEPNYIHIYYGHYLGNENVNNSRMINLLAKDGKLKELDLQIQ